MLDRRTLLRGALMATGLAAKGRVATTIAQTGSPVASGEGFAHPEWLVQPEWLAERLTDPGLLVIGFVPADQFTNGHIPGAVQTDYPDWEADDTSPDGLAAWQEAASGRLATLGVTPARSVVVYDDGTLYAARLWWVLHALGHTDVRVLDGGFAGWREAGLDVETGATEPTPAATAYAGELQPDLITTIDEAIAAVGVDGVQFLDARPVGDYAAGHIPGAVNVTWTENGTGDPVNRWKEPAALRALYEGAGITPDLQVIPYCATGVRSAVTAFTLLLLGYPEVALFTGSWKEWSADPVRPVAEGETP